MAWSIKALVINELTAARWQYIVPGTDMTAGDTIMEVRLSVVVAMFSAFQLAGCGRGQLHSPGQAGRPQH